MGIFDFETKKVMLNSGYEMPIMGLGTYALDYDTCVSSVTLRSLDEQGDDENGERKKHNTGAKKRSCR